MRHFDFVFWYLPDFVRTNYGRFSTSNVYEQADIATKTVSKKQRQPQQANLASLSFSLPPSVEYGSLRLIATALIETQSS